MIEYIKKEAHFSKDGKFRFFLTRTWDESKPQAVCIGLNPSTANGDRDDNTIRKLVAILNHNGYGSLYMTNLFSVISPNPEDISCCQDNFQNRELNMIHIAGLDLHGNIIFCWGNFKQAELEGKKIAKYYTNKGITTLCFGQNKNGSPKHPLYLKSTTELQSFKL